MKRLPIHVSVDDRVRSIRFYSALFACKPIKRRADYAKWMLDDPQINLAISARGAEAGIDHFGIQVEETGELEKVCARSMAEAAFFNEGGVKAHACCTFETARVETPVKGGCC